MKLACTSEASIGSFACGCLKKITTHVKAYAHVVRALQQGVAAHNAGNLQLN